VQISRFRFFTEELRSLAAMRRASSRPSGAHADPAPAGSLARPAFSFDNLINGANRVLDSGLQIVAVQKALRFELG
jgi:hypothetical protein